MSRVRTPKGWRDEGPRKPDSFATANLFDRFATSRRAEPLRLPVLRVPEWVGGARDGVPAFGGAA